MDNIQITNAQYYHDYNGNQVGINIIIEGIEMLVPLDLANSHYAEIMRQVEAGTLTIQEAN